jgi:hypothetical protein
MGVQAATLMSLAASTALVVKWLMVLAGVLVVQAVPK